MEPFVVVWAACAVSRLLYVPCRLLPCSFACADAPCCKGPVSTNALSMRDPQVHRGLVLLQGTNGLAKGVVWPPENRNGESGEPQLETVPQAYATDRTYRLCAAPRSVLPVWAALTSAVFGLTCASAQLQEHRVSAHCWGTTSDWSRVRDHHLSIWSPGLPASEASGWHARSTLHRPFAKQEAVAVFLIALTLQRRGSVALTLCTCHD